MPRIPRRDSDGRSHKKKPALVILPGEGSKVTVPKLPDIGREWHPLTVAWWGDAQTGLWASPMAHELARADVHGLLRVALLVDDFNRAETPKDRAALAGEIRLSGALFGLDPTSRRRLGWRIDAPKADNAVERWLKRGKDPRDVLDDHYLRNPS